MDDQIDFIPEPVDFQPEPSDTLKKAGYQFTAGLMGGIAAQAKGVEALSDIGPRPDSYHQFERNMLAAEQEPIRAPSPFSTTPFDMPPSQDILAKQRLDTEWAKRRENNPITPARKALEDYSTGAQAIADETQGNKFVAEAAGLVGGFVPYIAEAAVPVVGPGLAAAAGGLSEYGSAYEEALKRNRAEGMKEKDAVRAAQTAAAGPALTSTALFLALPGKGKEAAERLFAQRLAKASPLTRMAINTIAASTEGSGVMAANSLLVNAQAMQTYRPEMTWQEAWNESAKAAIGGFFGTALVHAPMEVLGKAREAAAEKREQTAEEKAFQEASERNANEIALLLQDPRYRGVQLTPSRLIGAPEKRNIFETQNRIRIPRFDQPKEPNATQEWPTVPEGELPRTPPRQNVPPNQPQVRPGTGTETNAGDSTQGGGTVPQPGAAPAERLASLNARAKAMGHSDVRMFNTNMVTKERNQLTEEQNQLLQDYAQLHKDVDAMKWDQAAELPDELFSSWEKRRLTSQVDADSLSGMTALHLALHKRGSPNAAEVLGRIQNSKRRTDWTLKEFQESDPDYTEADVKRINEQNEDYNDLRQTALDAIEKITGKKSQPAAPPPAPPEAATEYVALPAIRDASGNVRTGNFHALIEGAGDQGSTDGYITNKGRFVTREEADKLPRMLMSTPPRGDLAASEVQDPFRRLPILQRELADADPGGRAYIQQQIDQTNQEIAQMGYVREGGLYLPKRKPAPPQRPPAETQPGRRLIQLNEFTDRTPAEEAERAALQKQSDETGAKMKAQAEALKKAQQPQLPQAGQPLLPVDKTTKPLFAERDQIRRILDELDRQEENQVGYPKDETRKRLYARLAEIEKQLLAEQQKPKLKPAEAPPESERDQWASAPIKTIEISKLRDENRHGQDFESVEQSLATGFTPKTPSSEPILVYQHPDGTYEIEDGYHRAYAAIKNGKQTIQAKVITETPAAPPEKPAAPPAAKPPTKFTDVLSDADKAALEAAEAELRRQLGEIGTGVDPTILITAGKIATLYTKAGIKNFAVFAKQLKERMPDIWDKIKPHLKSVWEAAAVHNKDLDEPNRAEVAAVIEALDKPEAPKPLEAPKQSDAADKDAIMRIAGALSQGSLTRQQVNDIIAQTHGGTLATGVMDAKNMMDLVEAAVNRVVAATQMKGMDDHPGMVIQRIKDLKELLSKVPTQTTRTEEQTKMQQFSTPPTLAYVANWVAKLTGGDTVLEPSAGLGGLAVFAKAAGAKVLANELSPRRARLLRLLGIADRVTEENAEHLHALYEPKIAAGQMERPTVVVMNPPFSNSATTDASNTMIGAKHVEQALNLLPPGGRLVAIVGEGMADDRPAFTNWWNQMKRKYNVRANIGVSGNEYRKYGTTFGNQLVVIDKTGPTPEGSTVTGDVDLVEQLVPLLEKVRNDRPTIQLTANQPGGAPTPPRPRPGPRPTTPPPTQPGGGAGGRPGGANGGQPTDSGVTTKPDGGITPVGNGGRIEPGGSIKPATPATGGATDLRPHTEPTERVAVETRTDGKEVELVGDDGVFAVYSPTKLKIEGAQKHPTELVESASMASVPPVDPTYRPALPADIVTSGALSEAQLEQVVYAGQAFEKMLPNGERQGYFIGDGTGVGKGREEAGIITDNWNRGRKQHVWITKTKNLINDAKRDLAAMGLDPNIVIDAAKKVTPIASGTEAVAFLTYTGLSKYNPGLDANGNLRPSDRPNRMTELYRWLGKDFDGVIALDEVHKAGNAVPVRGTFGMKEPSQIGLSIVDLQKLFPKARILYVSATGATDVTNLSYGDRLGIWGPGKPFATKMDFFNKIQAGGLSAMEIVARDLKAMGAYMARTLSFRGVEKQEMTHKLTPEQTKMYDDIAEAWQGVFANVDTAMGNSGANRNGQARAKAMSAFWGAEQRFYNQLLTALQMPTVIENMRKDLAADKSVVLQMVNTNEATLNRELAEQDADAPNLEDLDLSPKDIMLEYVNNSFPTTLYQPVTDANGNIRWTPVLDQNGDPVQDPEAVRMKNETLGRLSLLKVPQNPLDQIFDAFGKDAVAEVTGRTKRVVWGKNERGEKAKIVERRNEAMRKVETDQFNAGKRRILVFTDAGGTGFSYHAGQSFKNQQQRSHYLIQAGWRADTALQGMGRTHRADQVLPPFYRLVSTNLKGHQRFISTIARRLGQLGALTSGERKTAGGGVFGEEQNLEGPYANEALHQLLSRVYAGVVPEVTFGDLTRWLGFIRTIVDPQTGERHTVSTLIDPATGALLVNRLPDVPQFLNRILALPVARQNMVFDLFADTLRARVELAKQQGRFDPGTQDRRALAIRVIRDEVAHTHESGAVTRLVDVEVDEPAHKVQWNDTFAREFPIFVRNIKSGHIYGLKEGANYTDDAGNVVETFRRYGIRGTQLIDRKDVKLEADWKGNPNYEQIPADQARPLWETEYDATPKATTENELYIAGAFLPIWDRIGLDNPRIYRLKTDKGTFLGAKVPFTEEAAVRRRLGAGTGTVVDATSVFRGLNAGQRFELANDWVLKRVRVLNEWRIEAIGPEWSNRQEWKDHIGGYTEQIGWQERFFLPNEEAAGVEALKKVLAKSPVVDNGDSGRQAQLPREEVDHPHRSFVLQTPDGDSYTYRQIQDQVIRHIDNLRESNELEGLNFKVKDVVVTGSRAHRGTEPRPNSDLDVVLLYEPETGTKSSREDDMFNAMNREKMDLGGVEVDINPIRFERYQQEPHVKQLIKSSISGEAEGESLTNKGPETVAKPTRLTEEETIFLRGILDDSATKTGEHESIRLALEGNGDVTNEVLSPAEKRTLADLVRKSGMDEELLAESGFTTRKADALAKKIESERFQFYDEEGGQAQFPAAEAAAAPVRETTAIGIDEIRKAFSDPRLGYDARTVQTALALLDQPVMRNLDWSKLVLALRNKLEGNTQGQAWVADMMIDMAGNADAKTFPHEMFHMLYELLPAADKADVNSARLEELDRIYGGRENVPDGFIAGDLRTDAFLRSGLPRDLYHLSTPSEYLAEFGSSTFEKKVFDERHAGRWQHLALRVKDWVKVIVQWAQRKLGMKAGMNRVFDELLRGVHKLTPEGGVVMEAKFPDRQASLSKATELYKQKEEELPGSGEENIRMEQAAQPVAQLGKVRNAIADLAVLATEQLPKDASEEAKQKQEVAQRVLKNRFIREQFVKPVLDMRAAAAVLGRAADSYASLKADPTVSDAVKSGAAGRAARDIDTFYNAKLMFDNLYEKKLAELKKELQSVLSEKAEANLKRTVSNILMSDFVTIGREMVRQSGDQGMLTGFRRMLGETESVRNILEWVSKNIDMKDTGPEWKGNTDDVMQYIEDVALAKSGSENVEQTVGATTENIREVARYLSMSQRLRDAIGESQDVVKNTAALGLFNNTKREMAQAVKEGKFQKALNFMVKGVGKTEVERTAARQAVKFLGRREGRLIVNIEALNQAKKLMDDVEGSKDFRDLATEIYKDAGVREVIRGLQGNQYVLDPVFNEPPTTLSLDSSNVASDANMDKLKRYRDAAMTYVTQTDEPGYDPRKAAGLKDFLDQTAFFMNPSIMPEAGRLLPSFMHALPRKLFALIGSPEQVPNNVLEYGGGLAAENASRTLNAFATAKELTLALYREFSPSLNTALDAAVKQHKLTPEQYHELILNPLAASRQYFGNVRRLDAGDAIGNGYTVTPADMRYFETLRKFNKAVIEKLTGTAKENFEVLKNNPAAILTTDNGKLMMRFPFETGPGTVSRTFGDARTWAAKWQEFTPPQKLEFIDRNVNKLLFGYVADVGQPSFHFRYAFPEAFTAILEQARMGRPIESLQDLVMRVKEHIDANPEAEGTLSEGEIQQTILQELDSIFKKIYSYDQQGKKSSKIKLSAYGGENSFNTERGGQVMPSNWYDYGSVTIGQHLSYLNAALTKFAIEHVDATEAYERALVETVRRFEERQELNPKEKVKAKSVKERQAGKDFYSWNEAILARDQTAKYLDKLKAALGYEKRAKTGEAEGMLGGQTILDVVTSSLLSSPGPNVMNTFGGAKNVIYFDNAIRNQNIYGAIGRNALHAATRTLKETLNLIAHEGNPVGRAIYHGLKEASKMPVVGKIPEYLYNTAESMRKLYGEGRRDALVMNKQLKQSLAEMWRWRDMGGVVQSKKDPRLWRRLLYNAETVARMGAKSLGQGSLGFVDSRVNMGAQRQAWDFQHDFEKRAIAYGELREKQAAKDGYDPYDLADKRNLYSAKELGGGRIPTADLQGWASRVRSLVRKEGDVNLDAAMMDFYRRYKAAKELERSRNLKEGELTSDVHLFTDPQLRQMRMAIAAYNNLATFANRPIASRTSRFMQVMNLFLGYPAFEMFKQAGAWNRFSRNGITKGRLKNLPFSVQSMLTVGLLGALGMATAEELKRLIFNRYSSTKTLLDAQNPEDVAEALISGFAGMSPFYGTAINQARGTAYRNGFDLNSQFVAVNLAQDAANVLKTAYQTGEIGQPLMRFAQRWVFPFNYMASADPTIAGLQEFSNTRNLLVKGAKGGDLETLLRKQNDSSFTYTPITPILNRAVSAIGRDDQQGFQDAWQEAVQYERDLGKRNPEQAALQALQARNPLTQVFNTKPTKEQLDSVMSRLTPDQQQRIEDVLQRFGNYTGSVGGSGVVTRQPPSTGSAAPATRLSYSGRMNRLRSRLPSSSGRMSRLRVPRLRQVRSRSRVRSRTRNRVRRRSSIV